MYPTTSLSTIIYYIQKSNNFKRFYQIFLKLLIMTYNYVNHIMLTFATYIIYCASARNRINILGFLPALRFVQIFDIIGL